MQWQALVASIGGDKTSGATELARRGATAVLEWIDQTAPRPFPALRSELLAFAAALNRAQPAMAPLFNLVNNILLAEEAASTPAALRQGVRGAAQAFLRHMDQANPRLAMATLKLLPCRASVLTFSYSSSVLAVLLEGQAHRRVTAVLCTESRPMQEGQHLARQLAGAGIAVQFGVDTAMATFARQANIVLVGADSLTAGGVVNKLGTTGLTLVARHAGLPCYVIGDRHKWFAVAAPAPVFGEIQPAVEVWPEPPAGVSIWNTYFECTPLELFSGIIGEEGLLAPEDLRRQLTDMPIARALRSGANAP